MRAEAGLAPLVVSPELSRTAQSRAEELQATGDIDDALIPGERLLERAAHFGYRASALSQIVAYGEGGPPAIVAAWRTRGDAAWKDVLRQSHQDLGIGSGWMDGLPLYVLLFGVSAEDAFDLRTATLHDAAAARADMLAAVNRARGKKKLPPVRSDPTLELVAQRHADDMFKRGYYGHASPEGTMVMRRTRSAGYNAATVGENIARGQGSVEEVMEGWMRSRDHRENIMNPMFVDAGFGLAIGRTPQGEQVLWVQVFGRPHGR